MSDLFEDPAPGGNSPEFSVSEISGAVKRVLEGEFGRVRVRGEVGRVSRPSSGHLYFDLKDSNAVLAAVSWKGQVARMQIRPEEGMEVVATGRLTTFPGQSKYQLIVEDVAPAGLGALMVMLEKRKAALAAEGLFDPARKKPIPFLPQVIGVVTSPSGAVIRDILHRLRDRFPRHVLIWPVAVQGEKCAPEVAAAIRGFNALGPGGAVPRPDLIIVARGGGSLEDLWGFNEEAVVRAAAASRIPLISAVGHETDTTLIDHAADRRAPTPTAAAEMAVPVRLDLLAGLDTTGARLGRALAQTFALRRQRVTDLSRALPRPDSLTGPSRQRLDLWADRLPRALAQGVSARRARLAELAATVRPVQLSRLTAEGRARLTDRAARLEAGPARRLAEAQARLEQWAVRLVPAPARKLADARLRLGQSVTRLDPTPARRLSEARARLDQTAARLAPALTRALAEQDRRLADSRRKLADLATRLDAAPATRLTALRERLEARDRLRQTLGHMETLKRGYAVVRGDGYVVTSKAGAEAASTLELQFHDGRLTLGGKAAKKPKDRPPEQGSLF